MTDNDIIKALDLCLKNDICDSNCKHCYYQKSSRNCMNDMIKDALDLINQQKEEIYKLQKENSELKNGYFQKHYEEMEHQELMGLRKAFRQAGYDYINLNAEWEGKYEKAKAEAVKEFAGEFKRSLINMPQKDINYWNLGELIDNLLKERVGDAK